MTTFFYRKLLSAQLPRNFHGIKNKCFLEKRWQCEEDVIVCAHRCRNIIINRFNKRLTSKQCDMYMSFLIRCNILLHKGLYLLIYIYSIYTVDFIYMETKQQILHVW